MTRLSVNINKVALIRNARGSNLPDLVQVAKDCERFGAEGITIHPRPDERHIKYRDAYDLKEVVTTELNIEGNPQKRFMNMVLEVKPEQCTLVPDASDQLTSDHGWDTVKHQSFLKDTIAQLHEQNIRVSIFIDPVPEMLEAAVDTGTDRIELYTGPYATTYDKDRELAVKAFREAALLCDKLNLGINAGHDLNLKNLQYFKSQIPGLLEVSIGHALICDALYFGLENVVQM
ncbi:MAG: pyridoxine 5'-phosphate synthase, partial [Chitinophagales bacterium]